MTMPAPLPCPAILIVEDEALISLMVEDFLAELGRRPAGVAAGLDEALAAVGQGGFDAVLLDVNLEGGVPSWPVADLLAARGIPFAFMSGGLDLALPAAHQGRPLLAKPFTLAALADILAMLEPAPSFPTCS
jgi:CheY-like chemotaxis protein